MHRAGDHRAASKPQPLTRPTLEAKTTPDDYDLFLAKWERYREGCLRLNHHNTSGIALQLWDCCPMDLKAILCMMQMGPPIHHAFLAIHFKV